MTTKTRNLMILLTIGVIASFGITSAYATSVEKTSNFSLEEEDQNGSSCGTNFTNSVEYACADAYNTGYSWPLAKAEGYHDTAHAEIRLNAEQVGLYGTSSTPELTTSASTVYFVSEWDLKGEIQKDDPSWQIAYLFYGHEIYKENWLGGWDEVSADCKEGKYDDFDNIETVSCSISNSGENTYRIGSYVEAKAQDNGLDSDDSVYVDFYTGSNYVKLTKLKIYD